MDIVDCRRELEKCRAQLDIEEERLRKMEELGNNQAVSVQQRHVSLAWASYFAKQQILQKLELTVLKPGTAEMRRGEVKIVKRPKSGDGLVRREKYAARSILKRMAEVCAAKNEKIEISQNFFR